jgi:hypothetical protein
VDAAQCSFLLLDNSGLVVGKKIRRLSTIADDTEMESYEYGEEEADLESERREMQLDLRKYLNRFANQKIIQVCSRLLIAKSYRQNMRAAVNTVDIFHRISIDLGFYPMFFQLSMFQLFEKILRDNSTKADQFDSVKRFAATIMSRFFSKFSSNE